MIKGKLTMGVRHKTKNRFTLFRNCYICGKPITTTADTPFVRQLTNVDGKKQKTCYFCSESCKQSTYKHLFDGCEWVRRKEREANRDTKEKNYKYYHTHEEEMRQRRRDAYYAMTQEERDAENAYRRKKHALNREKDNRKRREYRARKKMEAEKNGANI